MDANTKQCIADLETAKSVYTDVHKEYGQALAVRAAIDFLKRAGIDPGLLVPLLSAAADMADQEQKNATGKALKPQLEALQWARAAGAIDAVKRPGVSLSVAADEVSKAADSEISASELTEYRRNLRKGRARKDAVDAYWHTVKLLNGEAEGGRPKVALEFVRRTLVIGKKG